MINHTVLFKLRAFENETQKAEMRNQIKNGLLALRDKIDVLKFIEVGTNYQLEASSFDICLVTHFESMEDLQIYNGHPEHIKVLTLIKANIVGRSAVDSEF